MLGLQLSAFCLTLATLVTWDVQDSWRSGVEKFHLVRRRLLLPGAAPYACELLGAADVPPAFSFCRIELHDSRSRGWRPSCEENQTPHSANRLRGPRYYKLTLACGLTFRQRPVVVLADQLVLFR